MPSQGGPSCVLQACARLHSPNFPEANSGGEFVNMLQSPAQWVSRSSTYFHNKHQLHGLHRLSCTFMTQLSPTCALERALSARKVKRSWVSRSSANYRC